MTIVAKSNERTLQSRIVRGLASWKGMKADATIKRSVKRRLEVKFLIFKSWVDYCKAILALFALATLHVFGFIQIIPYELHSLIDSRFIFSRASAFSFAVVVSGLLTNLAVPFLRAAIWKAVKSVKFGWPYKTPKRFRSYVRLTSHFMRLHPMAANVMLFVLFFSISYLGVPFFYRILLVGVIGIGITMILLGGKRLKSGAVRFRKTSVREWFLALTIGAGAAAFILGQFSAHAQVYNYVEVVTDDGKKVGALLGSTATGIFLLEDYNWRKVLVNDEYSVIFLPNSSFDQIWTSPRYIEVFSDSFG